MSATISSEFLMLLAKAAPKDIAEVERLLRRKTEGESKHADGTSTAKAQAGELSGAQSGDAKFRSTSVFYHSIGNFHYLTGMEDVWVGTRRYDLREHKRARLALICMAEANAVDEKSALHFLTEIDPYVREHGKIDPLGKFSNIKIQDYFRDPTGELATLCQAVIKAVGGNGKYYIDAGAAPCGGPPSKP